MTLARVFHDQAILIGLLFGLVMTAHFLADFVFQSNWMAQNKSKSNKALSIHIAAYTGTAYAASLILGFALVIIGILLYPNQKPSYTFTVLFAVYWGLNAPLHWITDYFTSRWSSKLWAQQRVHDFFVVIGLDQLIHTWTLIILFPFAVWLASTILGGF